MVRLSNRIKAPFLVQINYNLEFKTYFCGNKI